MFLKAGALSLALLLLSRGFGLARESAQAAAFGASGLGDVAVLMLSLPDWLAGVLASGALAYVLLPHWAGQTLDQQAASQRRVAQGLLALGAGLAGLLALGLVLPHAPLVAWLLPGLGEAGRTAAVPALAWSVAALPAALLAALWATRLQHLRDFSGLYTANLVVNAGLIAALFLVANISVPARAVAGLGLGLLAAMGLRLGWLAWRQQRLAPPAPGRGAALQRLGTEPLPAPRLWCWAALSAGLPLALPFAARSLASGAGEGALATFNYAWKLVELPLLLAVQLVATLAFPAVAQALAGTAAAEDGTAAVAPVRSALALAWVLACAAAAGLLLGAPALAELLFGWGRMRSQGAAVLVPVAEWAAVGAWGLLPQALLAVALTVLATRRRLGPVVLAYALALLALLGAGALGWHEGAALMALLNSLLLGVAGVALLAMLRAAPGLCAALPWRTGAASLGALALLWGLAPLLGEAAAGLPAGLVLAVLGAGFVVAAGWGAGPDLRQALRR